jgi:hypothetical protein
MNVPFIFVALHYQPEATTHPLAGIYADQILMIKLLSANLPKGWKIYVKEHRTLFDPELRGHFSRNERYYEQICEIPNTILVPMQLSSFELIDKARAVATPTGTAAWESVVRGVPSLTFGNAWFNYCHGVFDCRNEPALNAALEKIEAGFKPQPELVRLFLKVLHEVGCHADRDSYQLTSYTFQESSQRLADYLLRVLPTTTRTAPIEAHL